MTKQEIESLFKTHYVRMYHLALTILFDETESKDAVSEVFARLLSSRTVLLPDTAEHYLMASVRNCCQNMLRHKQVRERFFQLLTEDGSLSATDNTAEEQLRMQELMRYIDESLSPQDRQIIRLRYLRDMTCQEVADAMGISRQTVHTHLGQAIGAIRTFFQDRPDRETSYKSNTSVI